jgi:hypothetical protein
MRALSLLIVVPALLLAAAAPALAQVAAPRLTPSQAGMPSRYNLVHVNALDISSPAPSIWSTSSLSAGAALSGDVSGPPGLSGSYTGGSARMNLVGEYVAFSLSRVQATLDVIPPAPTAARSFELTDTNFTLGLRFTDWLALGVGRQTMHTGFTDTGVPDDDVRSRDLPLLGASLRFWDSFYLGVASGSDTVRIESFAGSPGTGLTDEGSRSVFRWGLAYSSQSPGLAVHAEYYVEQRKPFALPLIFGPDTRDDAQLTGSTIEVVWANVLFAYEGIDQRITDLAGGIPTEHSSQSTRIALGWVPMGQMGLVLSRTTDRVDQAGSIIEFNGTAMNAVWRF